MVFLEFLAFNALSLMTFDVLRILALGQLFWSCKNALIACTKFKDNYKFESGNQPAHVSRVNQLDLFAFNALLLVTTVSILSGLLLK
jgi:hypothetical protein